MWVKFGRSNTNWIRVELEVRSSFLCSRVKNHNYEVFKTVPKMIKWYYCYCLFLTCVVSRSPNPCPHTNHCHNKHLGETIILGKVEIFSKLSVYFPQVYWENGIENKWNLRKKSHLTYFYSFPCFPFSFRYYLKFVIFLVLLIFWEYRDILPNLISHSTKILHYFTSGICQIEINQWGPPLKSKPIGFESNIII